MIKSDLRKTFLNRQIGLATPVRLEESRRIADVFFRDFDLRQLRFLHCFLPIGRFNEIDTDLILKTVWEKYNRIETLIPRVNFDTGEIDSLKLRPDTELADNSWGIPEPVHGEILAVDKIDMVLVPGLAFDENGHRVGYGKGFYDRFLTRCRPDCVKIGLSFFRPVRKIADVHAGDVGLNWLITPEGAIRYDAA